MHQRAEVGEHQHDQRPAADQVVDLDLAALDEERQAVLAGTSPRSPGWPAVLRAGTVTSRAVRARAWSTSLAICTSSGSTPSKATVSRSRAEEVDGHVLAVQLEVVAVEHVRLDPPAGAVEGRVGADRDRRRQPRRRTHGSATRRTRRRPGSRRPAAGRGSRSGSRARGRACRPPRPGPRPGAAGRAPRPRWPRRPRRGTAGRRSRTIGWCRRRAAARRTVEVVRRRRPRSVVTSPAARWPKRKFSPTCTSTACSASTSTRRTNSVRRPRARARG